MRQQGLSGGGSLGLRGTGGICCPGEPLPAWEWRGKHHRAEPKQETWHHPLACWHACGAASVDYPVWVSYPEWIICRALSQVSYLLWVILGRPPGVRSFPHMSPQACFYTHTSHYPHICLSPHPQIFPRELFSPRSLLPPGGRASALQFKHRACAVLRLAAFEAAARRPKLGTAAQEPRMRSGALCLARYCLQATKIWYGRSRDTHAQ